MEFTAIARRLGLFSAAATVVLLAAYAVTLTIGLLSLESPDQPIRNPMFAILEILIIVMMPAIVGLMIDEGPPHRPNLQFDKCSHGHPVIFVFRLT